MTLIPILIVLYFTTVFFAGELIWVYSIAELFVLFFSLIFLLIFVIRSGSERNTPRVIYKDPVTLFGLLFLALVAFQLIPLPPTLLKILSPMSFEIWAKSPLPSGSYFPISVHPYATKHGLIFAFCLLLVFFWVLYGIKTRQQMENLVLGILIFGALVALYGLIETATGHDHILWWEKTFGQGTVTATFFNRNHLATFLSMTLLIGVGYFWTLWASTKQGDETGKITITRQIEDRIENLGLKGLLTLLSLLILVFTLLTTASRGGNLSTLAGLILMAGLITPHSAKKKGGASFSLLITVIIAFGAYAAGDRLWERLKWEPLEQIQSTPTLNRPALNKDTWAMYRDYPSLGSGFNTFQYVFTRYAEHSPKYIDHAHNDWLELASEIGWAGLLIILSGLFFIVYRLLKLARNVPDPFSAGMIIGGLGVLLSVSLHSLTDFSLHKPANAFLLATILGLAFRAVYRRSKPPLKDAPGVPRIPAFAGMTTLGERNGKNVELFFRRITGRVFFALFILVGISICIWGANTVVRSFIMNLWIPVELDVTRQRPDPRLEEVLTSLKINPDNSAGWDWLSQTIHSQKNLLPVSVFKSLMENGNSRWAKANPDISIHAYQILFPVFEALSRRPVSPHYWYRLAFGGKKYLQENPSFFAPLIVGAFDNTIYFSPWMAIGYFGKADFCLHSNYLLISRKKGGCFQDFKRSLELEPNLIPLIIKSFEDNAVPMKDLLELLPNNSRVWISAGESLLKNGQIALGEEIYLKGEQLKEKETESLIEQIRKRFQGKQAPQIDHLLRELMMLDPGHPLIRYAKGDILKALEEALKRGYAFDRLDDINRLRVALINLNPKNEQGQSMSRFYLALLDLKQQNFVEATQRLDQVLKEKPNFFPALLAREQLLKYGIKTEEEKIYLEKIQEKLRLFSMEEIPNGAWVADGKPGETEQRNYRAVLRNDRPLSEIKITTPVEAEGWMVLVDDRFVTAREVQGNVLKIILPHPLVPGEHQAIIKPIKSAQRR